MSWIALSAPFLIGVAVGCVSAAPPPTAPQNVPAPRAQTLVLGDMDAHEPVKKIKRFQPLADYLAAGLGQHGISAGHVLVARDIDEMARYIANGDVDLYFDSPFPALAVQELAGSELILRRWKEGNRDYWALFVALKSSGINRVEDLEGRVVAVEDPFSTSGFLLPVGSLVRDGLDVIELTSIGERVGADEVGYYVSRDEENTVELVLQGKVAAGALSNEDLDALPQEVVSQLIVFGPTGKMPRQVVSVPGNMDDALVEDITNLLVGLDKTEQGRVVLEGIKSTTKFDVLPPDARGQLEELNNLIDLLTER